MSSSDKQRRSTKNRNTRKNAAPASTQRVRRHPGRITTRRTRVQELKLLLLEEQRTATPLASDYELERRVDERLSEILRPDPQLAKEYQRFAQIYNAPTRRGLSVHVEIAAALAHPAIAAYRAELTQPVDGQRTKDRTHAAGALTMLAAVPSLRTIRDAAEHVAVTPLARWATGDPTITAESTVYSHWSWLAQHDTHKLALAANIQIIRELAGDRAGVAVAVDGTKHPANVQQRSMKDPAVRELLLRERMTMVQSMKYTGKDNHKKDAWTGYKVVSLVDLATGLPLVWNLYDGDVDERLASQWLLTDLFSIWPDAPTRYIVGDGLYADSIAYLYNLEFAWGIHPVVPWLPGKVTKAAAFHSTAGVPTCEHGLMKRHCHDGFITLKRRAELGLQRGQLGPDDAHLRYVCAHGHADCHNVNVYTRTDGRVHPYHPHTSVTDSLGRRDRCHVRRLALELRRNGVESHHASIKGHLIGNTGAARTHLRDDEQTRHVIDNHCLLRTGIRASHVTDSYAHHFDAALQLGLLPTR